MEISVLNIGLTLLGYFGAIYTKDIILSLKKQKLIIRKLTSYINVVKKSILKNEDLSIIYYLLIDNHIKNTINNIENFEEYKDYIDKYEIEKKDFIIKAKEIIKNNFKNIYANKEKFNENWNNELINNIKESKKNIIGITDDEAGEINEDICELVIDLKSNVTNLLSSILILHSNIKSMKELNLDLIDKEVEEFIINLLNVLENTSKINLIIDRLNKRSYKQKILDQIFKNTF